MTDWLGDELHPEIEKFWRDKFAEEIESQVLLNPHPQDPETTWFQQGVKYAAIYIRYKGEGAS